MSHHIYHTRGLILSSAPSGESNKSYKIFTEELGLVGAHAQAAREGKSKLRYILHERTFVTLDLVRGKEVWRIVSAGANRPLEIIKKDPLRTKLFAEFCVLLARLLHGEGRDQILFEEIERVATFLEETMEPSLALSFETMYTFRALAHLGYLDPILFEKFLSSDSYTREILNELGAVRSKILPRITEALSASHM